DTIIGKKSTNSGWHGGAHSSSEIVDTIGEFILEGGFTDSGWLDIHSASVDWGDGTTENLQVTEENISPEAIGKISALHKYTELKNYMVKLTVTDDDGGIATSEITLESPKQIKQAALLKLNAIQTGNKTVRKEIDKAIKSLKESLKSKYWQDDFHLNLLSAHKFFSEEKKAIKSLEKITSDKKKYADFQDIQEVQEIIDELSQSNIFLAKIIVHDAGSLAAKNLKSAKNWIEEMLGL
ncbi:MAG: PKD domain-containing protein, partial [Candidatus Paceibacterota bacterium]